MLTSLHLHMKSRRVCIKTRSPPASLPLKGQVTRHTTVKWSNRAISSLDLSDLLPAMVVMHNNNGCVALETNNRANNVRIERPYLFPSL